MVVALSHREAGEGLAGPLLSLGSGEEPESTLPRPGPAGFIFIPPPPCLQCAPC